MPVKVDFHVNSDTLKNMFDVILLSLIQSATEFLPVSSSGHLILAEAFGLSDQTLTMDVALHFGTLLAVLAYFHKDVWAMFIGLFRKGPARDLTVKLMIGVLPIIIVGYFLHDIVETLFRSPVLIAFTSIFYGILLWWVDKVCQKNRDIAGLSYKGAFMIGCAQILALVPGTSRSGITMTCARFLRLSRTESARFSMLLSIPTIALGALYQAYVSYRAEGLSQIMSPDILWGVGLSGLFGLLAVWFLMSWVKKASFAIFAVYRVVLGIFLLIWFL